MLMKYICTLIILISVFIVIPNFIWDLIKEYKEYHKSNGENK